MCVIIYSVLEFCMNMRLYFIGGSQVTTSSDVVSGVNNSISCLLQKYREKYGDDTKLLSEIEVVAIGHTVFLNAIVQMKELTSVGLIRLCGAASTAFPPFSDFPDGRL